MTLTWMIKPLRLLIGMCLISPSLALADDTDAVDYAKQAGVVAGAAEACGQPITIMVMRSDEVINALAKNPMDKTYATAAFEKARADGHANMLQSQNISCAEVIANFNRLPLLQPDYQTEVIAKLSNNMPQASTNAATSQNTVSAGLVETGAATNNPVATLPAQKIAPPPPPPPVNPLAASMGPPPAQNYVSASNAPINPNATNPPPNTVAGAQTDGQQNTEMAKLQLAQQLAQIAQTLVTNNQTQIFTGPGVPSTNNPAYNSQLNEQLYGMGANNPIFTGAPLPSPVVPPSPAPPKVPG